MKWHFTVRRDKDDALSTSTVDKKYGETYSSLTQLTAWGLPAIQTLLVLVTRLVDADELIGEYVHQKIDRKKSTVFYVKTFFGSTKFFRLFS